MDFIAAGKTGQKARRLHIVAWVVLLVVTVLAYLPGLHGPFLLDDFGVLPALGSYGGVTDWETFKLFVLGGTSGPTGRPLSLLTFLLDANDWPADAFPFKRTNLIIHLLNGLLLGVLIRQLLAFLNYERERASWIALSSVALWLLHPFLVSTTLYVVQRMAQLSTLFILAGITTHLYARALPAAEKTKAHIVMTLSIGIFGILAMLSKENGILLPMLIGVIELTVLASQRDRIAKLNRAWAVVFLITPTAIIFAYLISMIFKGNFFDIVPPRDFSRFERVLTESRILVDYLHHWFVPKLYTTGVFQDHFIKSSGLFDPVTTAISLLFHIGVIALAFSKRHAWPLFALAVLFFYASHTLESTLLYLELYFEHRNYLAASLLFLPLICLLWQRFEARHAALVVLAIGLLLGSFTRYSAGVWADYPSMVAASAQKAPTSVRAQAQLATNYFKANRTAEALQILDRAIADIPGEHALLYLNRLSILCNIGVLDDAEAAKSMSVLAALNYDTRLFPNYVSFVDLVMTDRCPKVSDSSVRQMFTGMLLIDYNADPRTIAYSQIHYFIGYVLANEGDRQGAMTAFELSLEGRPGTSHAMQMAAVMASHNFLDEALRLSDVALQYRKSESGVAPRGATINLSDIEEFRSIVRSDLEAMQSTDTADPAP